jgi:hypothetical protein
MWAPPMVATRGEGHLSGRHTCGRLGAEAQGQSWMGCSGQTRPLHPRGLPRRGVRREREGRGTSGCEESWSGEVTPEQLDRCSRQPGALQKALVAAQE